MARIASLGAGRQEIFLVNRSLPLSASTSSDLCHKKPSLQGTLKVEKVISEAGGSGVNTAITFAKYGHEAIFLGNLARDDAGAVIIKRLDREGVDASYVNFLARKATGLKVILQDAKMSNRVVLEHNGASGQFGNLNANELELIQPDWLYVSTLGGDFDTIQDFILKARELGIKVMFNPGEEELAQSSKMLKILKNVDILALNKVEASKITSGKTLSELIYHLGNYTPITIITNGAMGGIAKDGNLIYRFGIYEDVKVKDITGAGDAFNAGFLAHFAAKNSFADALVFASANATSVIGKIGGNIGTLTGQEKLHLMPIQKI